MRKQTTEDYDYDAQGSTGKLAEPAPSRGGRVGATGILTTSLLIAGGLLGGTAFALTTLPSVVAPAATPIVQTTDSSSTGTQTTSTAATATPDPQATAGSGTDSAATSSETAAPSPSASVAPSFGGGSDDSAPRPAGKSGKTIAVPPAAFDDNEGDRQFHPAPGSTDQPTPPAYTNGDNHGHRPKGVKPTGTPSFSSEDGNSND